VSAPTEAEIQTLIDKYAESGIKRTPAEAEQILRMERSLDSVKGLGKHALQAAWDDSNEHAATQHDPAMTELANREFAPARNTWDYNLPPGGSDDASVALDNEMRTAMVKAGLPAWAGDSLGASLASASRVLERMTPDQYQERRAETAAVLERVWGSEFQARAQRVEAFVQGMIRDNPKIATQLTQFAGAIDIDWQALQTLSEVAEHQHRKRTAR
jgi:hypothetical protein